MKVKTINISIPEELLTKIDEKARLEYRSRSELFKEATVVYLQTKDNWLVLQKEMSEKAKKMNIKTENDVEQIVDSLRK
jgi:metal-responsive CopG/Arc/MetJ family transcriptional regulator